MPYPALFCLDAASRLPEEGQERLETKLPPSLHRGNFQQHHKEGKKPYNKSRLSGGTTTISDNAKSSNTWKGTENA